MMTLQQVAAQLRELDRQYANERDNVFAKMAHTVEAAILYAEDDDKDIDELTAKVDQLETGLRSIKRECGYREINAGTSTLGVFIDQLLMPRVARMAAPVCECGYEIDAATSACSRCFKSRKQYVDDCK